ncbi:tyrosine-type recombinase/integrase [Endozoicomonas sp.]|uniref:tyrosine-type recombinase/integrase n=1 Tax=Endozoicomonas sp. TaxID=1892382 RepID=UPI002886CB06|nr:site-specific integrase [Endozoicomonas sp.]
MASKKLTESILKKIAPDEEIRDTETKGFFARRRSTKTVFYYSYISPISGKRRNATLGTYGNITVDQARTAAKKLAADVISGIDPVHIKQETQAKYKSATQKTLDYFIDHDYKELTPGKQFGSATKTLRREFKKYLHIDMNDIDAASLNKWKLAHKRKPSSVNRYLNELRGAMTKAVQTGYLTKTIMPEVKPLKEDKKKRIRFLTEQEEEQLMIALDDRQTYQRHGGNNYNSYYTDADAEFTDYLKPMVIIGIYCGLRKGEIFNLQVKDIDFSNHRLFIEGEGVDDMEAGYKSTTGTKSAQTRTIPLHQKVDEALRAWLDDHPSDDLVFASPKTGGRFDNIKTAWNNLMTQAELNNVVFHTLRHTFGTRLALKRVDLETIRDLMGHESIETTQKYLQTNDDITVIQHLYQE